MSDRIRVVVADDSPFVCRLLTSYLQSTREIEVVATVLDGARAIVAVCELEPDAVTLDLEMPRVGGLEALQRIMEERPTPTVVISGVSGRAATMTLQALDFGAVDFVLKYEPGVDLDPAELRREIVAKVRAAAGIRVVRSLRPRAAVPRLVEGGSARNTDHLTRVEESVPASGREPPLGAGVVVIGASTGGPMALRELLAALPTDFPLAILIVQHMPEAFTSVLAAQLHRHSPFGVREAEAGEPLRPGTAFVAPGGFHLLLDYDTRVQLIDGPEIGGHRPSIDVTMQSAAQVYGSRARGVILTGMGDDGTDGLLSIHSKGGVTFAQDEASCVVFGMPKRALEKGVVTQVAPPGEIARLLARPDLGSSHQKAS